METTMVNNSEMGIASQIPGTPNIFGKNMIQPLTHTKVRNEDINADNTPFDNDVKNADAKILTPENNKWMAQILYPSNVIAYV